MSDANLNPLQVINEGKIHTWQTVYDSGGDQTFHEEFIIHLNPRPCGACDTCQPGQVTGKLGSVDVNINLGRGTGRAEVTNLILQHNEFTSNLWTPMGLVTAGSGLETILNGLVVRQLLSAEILADVVTTSSTAYEVHLYHYADRGTKNASGLYQPTGSVFRNVRFEKLSAQAGAERFLVTVNTNAVEEQRFEYRWNATISQWTLIENNRRELRRLETILSGGDHQLDKEVYDLQNNGSVLISKTREIWRDYAWGQEMVEQILDPAGAARSNKWNFWNDAASKSYSQVKWHTGPDGSWDTYEYNETNGRIWRHRMGVDDALFNSANPFAIADADCRVVETTWSALNSIETKKDRGIEISRRYRDIAWSADKTEQTVTDRISLKPGALKTDPSNLVTVSVFYGLYGDFASKPKRISHPDGTLSTFTYLKDANNITTITERTGKPSTSGQTVDEGRQSVTVTNTGRRLLSETVSDIAANLTLTSKIATDWDSFGRPVAFTYEDATTETESFACCGADTRTDRTGATTSFVYDDLKQISEETRDGITQIMVRDAEGRLRFIKRRGTNTQVQVVQENRYNLAGELYQQLDAISRPTEITKTHDTSGRLVVTTTRPGGGTEIQTYYLDGRLWKVEGTAVATREFVYGTASLTLPGLGAVSTQTTKEIRVGEGASATEWTKRCADMAGRIVRTYHSDEGMESSDYNSAGQLAKTIDADGVTMLFTYNGQGERTVEALDVNNNRNGIIDYNGVDRILKTTHSVVSHDAKIWQRTTIEQWQTDSLDAPTTVLQTDATANGRAMTSTQFGLSTTSSTAVSGGGNVVTTTTYPDNSSLVETREYGRLLASTRKDSQNNTISSLVYGYSDPFKRLKTKADSGTGTTSYTYYSDDQIETITTPDPDGAGPQTAQVTTHFYNTAGLLYKRHLPDNTDEFTEYWPMGTVKKQYGSRTYPVSYTYDLQGRLRTMTTHQTDPAAGEAVTEWIYWPLSGRLWKKKYQDAKFTAYSWSAGGRLLSRISARNITTTYGYNYAGERNAVTYSDAVTPTVDSVYNRRGLLSTMTDAAGIRALSYWASGELDDEVYTNSDILIILR